jgi:hypothetical protein
MAGASHRAGRRLLFTFAIRRGWFAYQIAFVVRPYPLPDFLVRLAEPGD